jgi:hypothetical protein
LFALLRPGIGGIVEQFKVSLHNYNRIMNDLYTVNEVDVQICSVHITILKLYGHGYEIFSLACDPAGKVLASSCKVIILYKIIYLCNLILNVLHGSRIVRIVHI